MASLRASERSLAGLTAREPPKLSIALPSKPLKSRLSAPQGPSPSRKLLKTKSFGLGGTLKAAELD